MDIFRKVQFSQEWIELGIISPTKLEQIEDEWNASNDRNTEHYRWRAFLDFMEAQSSLEPVTARRLYKLGERDPDPLMGGSMMAQILRRTDCPQDLLRLASQSDKSFLRKIAIERLADVSI